jgi:hypothetical protein
MQEHAAPDDETGALSVENAKCRSLSGVEVVALKDQRRYSLSLSRVLTTFKCLLTEPSTNVNLCGIDRRLRLKLASPLLVSATARRVGGVASGACPPSSVYQSSKEVRNT